MAALGAVVAAVFADHGVGAALGALLARHHRWHANGPVRLGSYEKPDGTRVPLWHDSEVAAVAYAIQGILARRQQDPVQQRLPLDELPEPSAIGVPPVMAGKKCPECGAHAMIRKDGCDYCTQCGYMGSCG